ncbi:MAG: hypothetical protein AB1796_08615 [Bacillota bacterium]
MRCKECGGESSWLLYPALFKCSRCGSVMPYKRSKKKALFWAVLSSGGWFLAAYLFARRNDAGTLFWLCLVIAFVLGVLLRRVLLR